MYLKETCTEDGKMSDDFMVMASNPKSVVVVLTSIGPVEVDNPEYRNSVTYQVICEEEV